MSLQRFAGCAAICVVTVGGVVGCSSSGDPGGSGSSASSSPAPTIAHSVDPALLGSWRANAADILGANTANVGGASGLTCTGPITMRFAASGTFTRQGVVNCSISGVSRSGRIGTAGLFATNGTQIAFSGVRSAPGSPVTDSISNGTATYSIDGTLLQITFDNPDVGNVTQTYRRLA